MTITEYAKSRNVSREAVRKQLVKYEKELAGHISNERPRILDAKAIKFLDEHRAPKNVVVRSSSEETDKQIKKMLSENNSLQGQILRMQDCVITIQQEKLDLFQKYLEQEKELSELRLNHERTKRALQELQAESKGTYQKTFFGLYRKVSDTEGETDTE